MRNGANGWNAVVVGSHLCLLALLLHRIDGILILRKIASLGRWKRIEKWWLRQHGTGILACCAHYWLRRLIRRMDDYRTLVILLLLWWRNRVITGGRRRKVILPHGAVRVVVRRHSGIAARVTTRRSVLVLGNSGSCIVVAGRVRWRCITACIRLLLPFEKGNGFTGRIFLIPIERRRRRRRHGLRSSRTRSIVDALLKTRKGVIRSTSKHTLVR